MNITGEKQNLMQLWLKSFVILNRCTGKLLLLVAASVFLLALFVLAMLLIAQQVPSRMVQLLGLLGMWLWSAFVATVFMQLVQTVSQEEQQPLTELFSASVLPAFNLLAANLILSVPLALLGLAGRLLPAGILWMPVLQLVLLLWVGVRIVYYPCAVALRHKSPLESFKYSWKLTAGRYGRTLLMCIMWTLTLVILTGVISTVLALVAPEVLRGQLMGGSLSWLTISGYLAGMIVAALLYTVPFIFPILVFLNTDAQVLVQTDHTFVPLPTLTLPQTKQNPVHAQQADATFKTPTQPAPDPKREELKGLDVMQTSVNTGEKDAPDLEQHLEKVYKPQKEDVMEYINEDRMPTILFDDDMAKLLQENNAQLAPKAQTEEKQPPKDDGDETIKMSK